MPFSSNISSHRHGYQGSAQQRLTFVPPTNMWSVSYFHSQVKRVLSEDLGVSPPRVNRYAQYQMTKEELLRKDDEYGIKHHHMLREDRSLSGVLSQLLRHDIEVAYIGAATNAEFELVFEETRAPKEGDHQIAPIALEKKDMMWCGFCS